MLKSTHRSAGLQPSTSLPEGWTEHSAPSGHKYYYNKTTKSSTYTRPTIEAEDDEEPLFAEEAGPDPVMQATLRAQEDFARNNALQGQSGHFTGGKGYQQRPRRGNGGDRPKKKAAIPDCAPWLLMTTRFGRRFVHNTETKQSLWKFPQDVMMAVIAMDKVEWDKKQQQQNDKDEASGANATPVNEKPRKAGDQPKQTTADAPATQPKDYDSDEYEEVEVTDDEDAAADTAEHTNANKRARLSATPPRPTGPADLTEDDIAFQLAAMEAEDAYSDPNDQYDAYNSDAGSDPDTDPGLPLTQSDQLALFRSLLDSTSTSPYTDFSSLLTLSHLIEDARWVSLPNMSARREAFASWSRDRVAELASLRPPQDGENNADNDPKVRYLAFLAMYASTKLYWPEFKRKYKKEEVMRGYDVTEKDREKVYREFVGKLKIDASKRRKELGELLKSEQPEAGKAEVSLKVQRDVRYWVVGEKEREELVRGWLG